MFNNKSILVTGGTGSFGHVVSHYAILPVARGGKLRSRCKSLTKIAAQECFRHGKRSNPRLLAAPEYRQHMRAQPYFFGGNLT
jgi:hypothetical protein